MNKQNQMILYIRISNIIGEVNDASKHVIKVFAECYISKLKRRRKGGRKTL